MGVVIGGKVMFADTRGPSSLKLDELADVTITSPVQGNFLAYNATTLEWQNRDIVATDLPASGVVPTFYGSSNTVPVITVDAAGRITAASSVPIATASETAFGLIEIATIPETTAGVDSSRAVTPAGVAAVTATLQPGDATLTGLSAVTTAADTLIYATGVDTFTSTGLTAFGRSLIDDASATAARTTLGLGTAATTDASAYQPADATLTGLANVTTAANTLIYAIGANSFDTVPVQAYGLTVLNSANGAALRTTLGLENSATIAATSANTQDTLVLRDNLGNFSAGIITASLTGVASNATKLATARTINGVAFDGTANITVADATKLPLSGGTITGSLNVTGNLSVSGEILGVTRTVSTGDNAILLNSDLTTGTAAQSGGFYVYQGPDTGPNGAQGLVWNQSVGEWQVQSRTGVIPPPGGSGSIDIGTQTAAFRIWTAGNDGAGSTLDADLLDGQQGTFYQNATNLSSGTIPAARLPAFTGDVTSAVGTVVNTLVATGVVANTYGTSTAIPSITVDAKGRITNAVINTIPATSETVSGLIELATIAEATAGTDTVRAVTPAGLAAGLATKANISHVHSAADITSGTLVVARGGTGTTTSTGTGSNVLSADPTFTGTANFATIVASGNVTAFSDARIKTNIEAIPDALEKVCTLRGVTYDRIDTGERQTGLIAQEVQAILPEAVTALADENQTLTLAYGNMMGLMVEAIKELTAKIANQDKIIHDLLQRIQ